MHLFRVHAACSSTPAFGRKRAHDQLLTDRQIGADSASMGLMTRCRAALVHTASCGARCRVQSVAGTAGLKPMLIRVPHNSWIRELSDADGPLSLFSGGLK